VLKEFLASGQAVAFSGPVIKGYGKLTDGVCYGEGPVPKTGHGQLLVGYDDSKGTAGKQGAFLVQNSMGDDWPQAAPGGRIWVAYDTFLDSQKLAAVAYPRDPSPPSGAALKGNSKGPAASIRRAFQWASPESGTYLVLMHTFAEPVFVKSVVLKEPHGKVVTTQLGQFIQSGYTYVRRSDGKAFESGAWTVTVEGETVAKDAVTYTGSVTVGDSAPTKRAAAPLASHVYGPTGAQAQVR
jgi:hypothetical protein